MSDETPAFDELAQRPVVVELTWTENGSPVTGVFGPWDQGESGEEHLGPVQEFLREAMELVPVSQANQATIAILLDPQDWLSGRREAQLTLPGSSE